MGRWGDTDTDTHRHRHRHTQTQTCPLTVEITSVSNDSGELLELFKGGSHDGWFKTREKESSLFFCEREREIPRS